MRFFKYRFAAWRLFLSNCYFKRLINLSIFALISICTLHCQSNQAKTYPNQVYEQKNQRVTHVFVALCDNDYQGIVPVPSKIGNGQDPRNNLYWGALYGVKTFFKKQAEWTLVQSTKESTVILERLVFQHQNGKDWLVADAYDGQYMEQTVQDYMFSLAGDYKSVITVGAQQLGIHGNAKLLAFVGHNGLMDSDAIDGQRLGKGDQQSRKAIMLACISKDYFLPLIEQIGAAPLVLTTGLMAPEAYTLDAAIDAFIANKSNLEIHEAAAQAYNNYQKCGLRGAKRLFWTQE